MFNSYFIKKFIFIFSSRCRAWEYVEKRVKLSISKADFKEETVVNSATC